jgi:DNA topoisomerase
MPAHVATSAPSCGSLMRWNLSTALRAATLTEPRVQAKQTQPPPRYSEGTLVDAMQNAWRFVKDEALRERLKEAKGIGTPATRAEIIKGLKRQNLLAADGKLVVPTRAGLQLFELLRERRPRAGRSRDHGSLGDASRRSRGRQGGFPRRHRRDRRRGGSVDHGA